MQEISPADLKVGQQVIIESVALERTFPAVVRERYLKDNAKDGRFLLDDATGFDMTGEGKGHYRSDKRFAYDKDVSVYALDDGPILVQIFDGL